MTILTLAHIAGDCGNTTSDNSFDQFSVKHGNQVIANVRFGYWSDDEDVLRFTASCTDVDHANAPEIFSEVHIVSCVTTTILRAFTADHEFYCDVFINAAGDKVELPLFDPLKA